MVLRNICWRPNNIQIWDSFFIISCYNTYSLHEACTIKQVNCKDQLKENNMIIISTLRSKVKLLQYRLKFIGQDQRVNEDFQAIILKPQKPGKSNKATKFY